MLLPMLLRTPAATKGTICNGTIRCTICSTIHCTICNDTIRCTICNGTICNDAICNRKCINRCKKCVYLHLDCNSNGLYSRPLSLW